MALPRVDPARSRDRFIRPTAADGAPLIRRASSALHRISVFFFSVVFQPTDIQGADAICGCQCRITRSISITYANYKNRDNEAASEV